MHRFMTITEAIKILDSNVDNPTLGLPDDIFYYISRTTPLINVDLLIKNKKGQTLLAWRDDEHVGSGWHIPGGIIRYKETIENRINKVAKLEAGCKVEYEPTAIAVNEIIANFKRDRAHFISLLYNCKIVEPYNIDNKKLTPKEPGYLKWFDNCPIDLLSWHDIYKEYL